MLTIYLPTSWDAFAVNRWLSINYANFDFMSWRGMTFVVVIDGNDWTAKPLDNP